MNTFNKTEFLKIVDAYLENRASEKQIALIDKYYNLFDIYPNILEETGEEEIEEINSLMQTKIDQKIQKLQNSFYSKRLKYFSIAAVVLAVSSVGVYFYQIRNQQLNLYKEGEHTVSNIIPGCNKAILILANGDKVSLSDATNGKIAEQSGSVVNKISDGQLVYNSSDTNSSRGQYNSIETPKGGQYQITLPDQTKVWLNAASSLKYPLNFSGNERKVELYGEAYFEVAKNKDKPFKVLTNKEVVEVLGTHFNISAYDDDSFTKTSLLEGSVKVTSLTSNAQAIIKPGQQSLIDDNVANRHIDVKSIDVDEAVAWKNGYFMFESEPLESVLIKISRWYDVLIQYNDSDLNKTITFSGTLSKYNDISKVLNKLELAGSIRFKIDGRKIIVIPPPTKQ